VPPSKFSEVVSFYLTILAPIRYKKIFEYPTAVGIGEDKPDFTIWATGKTEGNDLHLAFGAKDRASIKAFHEAAMGLGAKDNGPPGLREYHKDYYSAFVIDPVGNNIEVCCHLPE